MKWRIVYLLVGIICFSCITINNTPNELTQNTDIQSEQDTEAEVKVIEEKPSSKSDKSEIIAAQEKEAKLNALLLVAEAEPQQLLALEQGNSSPLPRVNHIDLSNIFEPEFADTVFAASIGQWSGPFFTNRGQHWLRITERVDARLPSLSEISDQVRLDWITEKEEALLQVEVDKLWDQYTIVIRDAEQE